MKKYTNRIHCYFIVRKLHSIYCTAVYTVNVTFLMLVTSLQVSYYTEQPLSLFLPSAKDNWAEIYSQGQDKDKNRKNKYKIVFFLVFGHM